MLNFLGTKLNAGVGCPGGTLDNSPAFQRRGGQKAGTRPEGTTEKSRGFQPSLRDSGQARPSDLRPPPLFGLM